MTDIPITSLGAAERMLSALEQQLAATDQAYDLVVVGGAALLALGLVRRPTRDVDVVALAVNEALVSAETLPHGLIAARDRVARDLGLPKDWLNNGPAEMIRFGLPDGFASRWTVQRFGPALTVRWASRLDQVHLKLYAAVDRAGKHLADLQALDPLPNELIAAARWTRQHDPSEGHLASLREALTYLGVADADLDV